VVLGFTNRVREVEIDGVTYKTASGTRVARVRSTAGRQVNDSDIESVFFSDGSRKRACDPPDVSRHAPSLQP
jgi:hypothetical protein